MSYDFTLDKKGIVSVLASWVVMGLLLFAAGLIVGTYWTSNGSSASAAASAKAAGVADKDVATLPQEPVLRTDVSHFDLLVPARPGGTLSTDMIGPAQLAAPQQKAGGPPQPLAAPPDQAAGSKPANGPADVPEQSIQTAPAETAPSPNDKSTINVEIFTIQVGTFLDQTEASHVFKDLQRKGYAPTFFSDRDAQDRQWYAIRIGAYSDKDQAANAAANFAKQEKMKAVVRPFGSL